MASRERPPLPVPAAPPLPVPAGLAERLEAIGAPVAPGRLEVVGAFLARLIAANAQLNLTAILAPAEAWERHGFDALTLLGPLAALPAGARVLDVGSGGGVPGLPLAIARPDLAFTLLDSTEKKTVYLQETARALGLDNVAVRVGRAETLAREKGMAGAFDAVTARAVARLAALIPLTVPFVRPGGMALLIKGQRADEELAEAAPVLAERGATHERTVLTPTGRIVVLRAGPATPSA